MTVPIGWNLYMMLAGDQVWGLCLDISLGCDTNFVPGPPLRIGDPHCSASREQLVS